MVKLKLKSFKFNRLKRRRILINKNNNHKINRFNTKILNGLMGAQFLHVILVIFQWKDVLFPCEMTIFQLQN